MCAIDNRGAGFSLEETGVEALDHHEELYEKRACCDEDCFEDLVESEVKCQNKNLSKSSFAASDSLSYVDDGQIYVASKSTSTTKTSTDGRRVLDGLQTGDTSNLSLQPEPNSLNLLENETLSEIKTAVISHQDFVDGNRNLKELVTCHQFSAPHSTSRSSYIVSDSTSSATAREASKIKGEKVKDLLTSLSYIRFLTPNFSAKVLFEFLTNFADQVLPEGSYASRALSWAGAPAPAANKIKKRTRKMKDKTDKKGHYSRKDPVKKEKKREIKKSSWRQYLSSFVLGQGEKERNKVRIPGERGGKFSNKNSNGKKMQDFSELYVLKTHALIKKMQEKELRNQNRLNPNAQKESPIKKSGSSKLTKSWLPPAVHRWTTSYFAQDSLECVLDLGWTDFHIVGLSMGGMISQELAYLVGEVNSKNKQLDLDEEEKWKNEISAELNTLGTTIGSDDEDENQEKVSKLSKKSFPPPPRKRPQYKVLSLSLVNTFARFRSLPALDSFLPFIGLLLHGVVIGAERKKMEVMRRVKLTMETCQKEEEAILCEENIPRTISQGNLGELAIQSAEIGQNGDEEVDEEDMIRSLAALLRVISFGYRTKNRIYKTIHNVKASVSQRASSVTNAATAAVMAPVTIPLRFVGQLIGNPRHCEKNPFSPCAEELLYCAEISGNRNGGTSDDAQPFPVLSPLRGAYLKSRRDIRNAVKYLPPSRLHAPGGSVLTL